MGEYQVEGWKDPPTYAPVLRRGVGRVILVIALATAAALAPVVIQLRATQVERSR
jgi:hypothetical protein